MGVGGGGQVGDIDGVVADVAKVFRDVVHHALQLHGEKVHETHDKDGERLWGETTRTHIRFSIPMVCKINILPPY